MCSLTRTNPLNNFNPIQIPWYYGAPELIHMSPGGYLICYCLKQQCERTSSEILTLNVSQQRLYLNMVHTWPSPSAACLSFLFDCCATQYRNKSVSSGLACSLSPLSFLFLFPLWFCLSTVLIHLSLILSDDAVLCQTVCEHSVF